jgi:predicted amidohydrolase
MTRTITVGGAQLGPIARSESRASCVARMIELMRRAHARGCRLVVFPELALTTFFPRWLIEDEAELDAWYEREMPNRATRPLFDEAQRLGIGFYLGYAELVLEAGRKRRYNTAILVDPRGAIVGKYRKVHLPGHADYRPHYPFQHLEKRYFEPGDLGFPVWRTMGGVLGMAICNDRRWPETYRVMGLQGVELILLGFNTPALNRDGAEPAHLRVHHSDLVMAAGAYQNATWVVGVAKAGREEGVDMIGSSVICAPSGEIVARSTTLGDELITADCDLDQCMFYKTTVFDFAAHRRIEHYGIITSQTGAIPPG